MNKTVRSAAKIMRLQANFTPRAVRVALAGVQTPYALGIFFVPTSPVLNTPHRGQLHTTCARWRFRGLF
jgi:hypothetical protein